ncbi:MAG: hypothetical protein M1819_004619 [Sarea resinae]|nr:MAG: hypothetical protein M1819_004619 [Sarea resinae]
MASAEVAAALSSLESSSTPQQNKASGYVDLLQKIISSDSPPPRLPGNLTAFLDSILGDTLGIVTARPLLSTFVDTLKSLSDTSLQIEIGQHALTTLAPRVVSFEEQDANLREILADAHESEGDYLASAKVLQGLQLESSQRLIPDTTKVKIWIRIVRLFLEEDDPLSAETYLNRAKSLIYKVQGDNANSPEAQELNLMFSLSQARILDARRKFLDASQVYHTFSFSPLLAESERLRALSSAIVCAVLSPAGPQRSRMLSRLYKDERTPQTDEHGILEKMFLDRLLSPQEVSQFAARLSPHHLATTSDGSTVLAKAVTEHNLLASSRLYSTIGVADLAALLDLTPERAEEYAARMIEQSRLAGRIDQIDGVIFFDGDASSDPSVQGGAAAAAAAAGEGGALTGAQSDRPPVVGRELRKWDANVQSLAEEVEKVTTLLQTRCPEFVAANLVH